MSLFTRIYSVLTSLLEQERKRFKVEARKQIERADKKVTVLSYPVDFYLFSNQPPQAKKRKRTTPPKKKPNIVISSSEDSDDDVPLANLAMSPKAGRLLTEFA